MFFSILNKNPKIIITGNQKSGTTAITKLLGFAAKHSVQNDIPELWPPYIYDYLLNQKKIGEFISNRGNKYFNKKIVKEPNLTFFLSDLVKLFPDTKFIFIVRDPRDNIRSILNRRSIPGNLMSLNNTTCKTDERKTFIGNDKIWIADDNHYISQQALKWVAAVDAYKKIEKSCHLVRYEDFMLNKIQLVDSLMEDLCIEKKQEIHAIKDTQFQPGGNNNLSWIDFFGYDNLSRIEHYCSGALEEFGYVNEIT